MYKDKPNTNLRENSELAVELYDAYERLSKNADFQKVIEFGFMELYSMNQVSLLAAPNTDRASIYSNLHGISVLQNFLITIERLGEGAKAALQEQQEAELDSVEG